MALKGAQNAWAVDRILREKQQRDYQRALRIGDKRHRIFSGALELLKGHGLVVSFYETERYSREDQRQIDFRVFLNEARCVSENISQITAQVCGPGLGAKNDHKMRIKRSKEKNILLVDISSRKDDPKNIAQKIIKLMKDRRIISHEAADEASRYINGEVQPAT